MCNNNVMMFCDRLFLLLFVVSFLGRDASVFVLSLEAEWIQLNPSSQRISPRRSGHVAFSLIDDKNKNSIPFVFGGYTETEKKDEPSDDSNNPMMKYHRQVSNDLWQFQNDNWNQVEHLGDIPGPRLVSTAAVVNNKKAYLMGGWDPETAGTGGKILDSIHELDLDTNTWTTLKTTMPDGPTSRHVALARPDDSSTILVHNHRCLDHIWLFDCDKQEFSKQPVTGEAPSSRGLHAATLVDPDHLLVFGGAAQDGEMSNEAFVLNLPDWKWTKIAVDETQPCPGPRAGPCVCTVSGSCVLVFGGAERAEMGLKARGDVWALQLNDDKSSGTWELLCDEDLDDNNKPKPRNAATLTEITTDNAKTRKFLLIGGWAPFQETWDDSFVLVVHL